MRIKALNRETYEKIAAGEVIDRPASIVRELIDNSLDAEADQIRLSLTEGGKSLIQIHDNGFGMTKEDLEICFLKHTTSKIKEFEDIYKSISLGFRGEALNSISIVSELEICSKTNENDVGNCIKIKEGKLLDISETAFNTGTNIKVKNLFFNLPVRRKSLKSDTAEFRQIKDVFIQKSIPFYDRNFILTHNGKEVYNSNKSENPLKRIELFYSKDVRSHLIEIEQEFKEFTIHGYISESNYFKPNKKYQHVFVNQRPIFSGALSHAMNSAYEGICPIGQHPLAFIFIQMNPELTDVNIHPTKREIKLLIEKELYHGLYHLIKEAVTRTFSIPTLQIHDPPVKEAMREYYQSKGSNHDPTFQFDYSQNNQKSFQSKLDTSPVEYDQSTYKILGVLFHTYILLEKEAEFFILDQHAAHERLEYEKIKAKLKDKNISSQGLLTPFVIDFSEDEFTIVSNNLTELKSLGYDLEIFGESSFSVNAIPFFIKDDKVKENIEKLTEDILDNKTVPDPLKFIDESLKMKACKTAVKSGDSLSYSEIEYLLKELMTYPNPFACPHGRPTALKMSRTEIEKMFLRI